MIIKGRGLALSILDTQIPRQWRVGTMPAKHDDADRRVRCTPRLCVLSEVAPVLTIPPNVWSTMLSLTDVVPIVFDVLG